MQKKQFGKTEWNNFKRSHLGSEHTSNSNRTVFRVYDSDTNLYRIKTSAATSVEYGEQSKLLKTVGDSLAPLSALCIKYKTSVWPRFIKAGQNQ